MRLVGAGLSKTGTTSLHAAVARLGYSSLHYDTSRLRAAVEGPEAQPSFCVYDDIDAVFDIPASFFFEQLLLAYPDAKCILTVRDEDAWWRSIRTHFNERSPVRRREDNPFKWDLRHLVYGSNLAEEKLFRNRYREHNDRVPGTVPPGRLLVMDITAGDGWEKLCPFLEEPIPPFDFPESNTQGHFSPESREAAHRELAGIIGTGRRYAMVDQQWLAPQPVPGSVAVPLIERDGEDHGPPAGDADAVQAVEQLPDRGVEFVVFTWPCFWWLDHYPEMHRQLGSKGRCVAAGNYLSVFSVAAVAADQG